MRPGRLWWFSCSAFTIGVYLDDDDVIVEAPPIARRFVGRPSGELGRWMRELGDFDFVPLSILDQR